MFDEIIGHTNVKQKLQSSILNNKLSHSYVFYGQNGIGKKTLALSLARKLLGVKNLESCVDFKLIKKVDGKQDITVEQVRNIIVNDVYISPASSKYKIYVIDDAGCMNLAAQNALLKTLEEPPLHAIIILIADSLNLLIPTIVSRTNNVFFNNLTTSQVKEVLLKLNITVDEKIFALSSGSVGQVLSIHQNNVISNLEEIIEYIKEKNILKLLNALGNLDLKNTVILDCFQRMLLNNEMYHLVDLIEETKIKLQNNISEEIEKTALAIKLCKK